MSYDYLSWESGEERIKHKSLALFSGDEPFYLEMVSSITRYQTFALDAHFTSSERDPFFEFPPRFYEMHSCRLHHSLMASDHHCYIPNIGLPMILSSGYYLSGAVGSMLTLSVLFSFQGIFFYKIGNHFTNKNSSLFLAILISLSTVLLSFSSRIYPDFVAGFFLIGAIYFFFFRKNTFFNIVITGIFLSYLPFLKSPFLLFTIILLPIMLFSLLKKHHFNNAFQLLITFSILLLIFYYLMILFSPVEVATGVGGGYITFFMNFFTGDSSQIHFLIQGLERFLFGQDYGLLIFSPLALLSIFGIRYVWSFDRYLFLSIVLSVISFTFILSFTAPYSGGWSLPGRYILPILPLILIPIFPLFEKFKKNIIFHLLILLCTYVGVSLNIIFSRTIYGHFSLLERNEILNHVYFGLVKGFPLLHDDPNNLWIHSYLSVSVAPAFNIFIVVLISIFITFTFFNSIKTIYRLKFGKLLFLISILIIYGTLSYVLYVDSSNYFFDLDIDETYNETLKRDPTKDEIEYWKNLLENNTVFSNDMNASLLESEEGIIVKKISEIYGEILGREPDSSGIIHWKEKILNNEITFNELENIIRNSPEAQIKP